jgi:polar amino acid transport system substrate-binding protein
MAGALLKLLTRCGWIALLALAASPFAPEASLAQGVQIPNFWDPRARVERPDLTGFRTVRFLVDDEFPPLHISASDGAPTGFSVELARAACERLSLACTVQVRRFDTLLDALAERNGDVVAAAIPITAGLRQRFSVTAPYFKIPGRFAARKDRALPEPQGRTLQGRSVAVVQGTAHEAFLKLLVPGVELRGFPDLATAQAVLRAGEVDYVFADGLSLALWLGSATGIECCRFTGGPFLESRFFGEGIGFIVRPEDEVLRRALDHALQRLWDDGKYAELYLRFFPVSPF